MLGKASGGGGGGWDVHYPCIEVKIVMSIHPLEERMDVL